MVAPCVRGGRLGGSGQTHARPGALFCLGINSPVFDQKGFGSAFARLESTGRITPVDFREVRFYQGVDHEHAGDRGLAALFRKR